MFGFQGGESPGTVERKRGYMKDAQGRWPFITNFDASTVRNEIQLATLVGDRSGIGRKEAREAVQAWMADKQF